MRDDTAPGLDAEMEFRPPQQLQPFFKGPTPTDGFVHATWLVPLVAGVIMKMGDAGNIEDWVDYKSPEACRPYDIPVLGAVEKGVNDFIGWAGMSANTLPVILQMIIAMGVAGGLAVCTKDREVGGVETDSESSFEPMPGESDEEPDLTQRDSARFSTVTIDNDEEQTLVNAGKAHDKVTSRCIITDYWQEFFSEEKTLAQALVKRLGVLGVAQLVWMFLGTYALRITAEHSKKTLHFDASGHFMAVTSLQYVNGFLADLLKKCVNPPSASWYTRITRLMVLTQMVLFIPVLALTARECHTPLEALVGAMSIVVLYMSGKAVGYGLEHGVRFYRHRGYKTHERDPLVKSVGQDDLSRTSTLSSGVVPGPFSNSMI